MFVPDSAETATRLRSPSYCGLGGLRPRRSEVEFSLSGGPSPLRWGGGEGENKNKKTQGARGAQA